MSSKVQQGLVVMSAVMQMKRPIHEIKWKGLWDKNSDKLYAPAQLLPQEIQRKDKGEFEAKMRRFGDLYERPKKIMKFSS